MGGVAPEPPPGVVSGVGVAGVVVGMGVRGGDAVFAPGMLPGTVEPGVAVLGSVPGVAVLVPELGGGGPASACPGAGGIFVVLIGSATWAWLSVGLAGRGRGVSSFDVGALFPNGLR